LGKKSNLVKQTKRNQIMSTMKKRVTEAQNFRTRSSFVEKEFAECAQFFQNVGLRGVFLFFGSARARSAAQIEEAKQELNKRLENVTSADERASIEKQLASWKRKEWLAPVWDLTAELARLLTEWAVSEEGVSVGHQVWSLLPGGDDRQPLQVCTGGGPGFMEAGNYGASLVPGSESIGVAVKLPFEDKYNPYLDESHAITVNSFYARKYWETYAVKAMICCPGGFGTLDEMFEVLTLVQCKHCPKIPVVLLGKDFWNNAINFKFLAEKEVISKDDVDQLLITDSAEEAFKFIVDALRHEAARMASLPSSPQVQKVGSFNAGDNSNSQPPVAAPFRRDRHGEQEQQDGKDRLDDDAGKK
jgi:uncharacterized protein (TIGR00730 family)